ncbi:cell division/cell wall cluster transcriptional repressor MraZ [Rhodobacterales bacterium HKCCE2091]|nr:cell division/cell wall cluster transcriptional repressor MraZ [Rhodobacterales bacterium HKCCE2091]
MKVDGKGRVAIPAKFRRVLQNSDARMPPGGNPRLFIAYGNPTANFLDCLSGNAFDQIDGIIQNLPLGSEAREMLEDNYYEKCDEMTVDDSGRLVLSPAARAKLGLEDEALFRGRGDKFRILRPESGAKADDRIQKLYEKLGRGDDFFDPLSLVSQPQQAGTDGT